MAQERVQAEIETLGRDYVENVLKFSFTSMETKRMANLLLKSFLHGALAQCEILSNKLEDKDTEEQIK